MISFEVCAPRSRKRHPDARSVVLLHTTLYSFSKKRRMHGKKNHHQPSPTACITRRTLEAPNTSRRDALSSTFSQDPKIVGSPGKYLSSTWCSRENGFKQAMPQRGEASFAGLCKNKVTLRCTLARRELCVQAAATLFLVPMAINAETRVHLRTVVSAGAGRQQQFSARKIAKRERGSEQSRVVSSRPCHGRGAQNENLRIVEATTLSGNMRTVWAPILTPLETGFDPSTTAFPFRGQTT